MLWQLRYSYASKRHMHIHMYLLRIYIYVCKIIVIITNSFKGQSMFQYEQTGSWEFSYMCLSVCLVCCNCRKNWWSSVGVAHYYHFVVVRLSGPAFVFGFMQHFVATSLMSFLLLVFMSFQGVVVLVWLRSLLEYSLVCQYGFSISMYN